ncbi:MAG: CsgG/HfaB family protein [Granulosicoccaceae bacterium]
MKRIKFAHTLLALGTVAALSGCMATNPVLGGSEGNAATGAAGGANTQGENSALEKCDEPLGTLGVVEKQSSAWYSTYRNRYPTLGSTVPVLRLMIQQSNCFVVVERGNAMNNMNTERDLANSGELREGSNFGKGQMVAADYTMAPSIQFAEKGTGGVGGLLAGKLGSLGSLVAGGLKKNEAATTLLLVDNRSGIQVSAAVGSAKNYDMKLFGGFFGGGLAGAGAFGNTPEGKLLTAAFTDSYNQMIKALRNYQAQEIKGGAGKGGKLGVSN